MTFPSWHAPCLRIVLAAAMGGSAFAKLLSGHQPGLFLSQGAYLLVSCIEIVLAASFLTRRWSLACHATLLLAAAGICYALFGPSKPCGCLGSAWALTRREHLMVAGSFGALASLALRLRRGMEPAATHDDSARAVTDGVHT